METSQGYAGCFEQILEVLRKKKKKKKTAAIKPLTFHLKNYPIMMIKTFWALPVK